MTDAEKAKVLRLQQIREHEEFQKFWQESLEEHPAAARVVLSVQDRLAAESLAWQVYLKTKRDIK